MIHIPVRANSPSLGRRLRSVSPYIILIVTVTPMILGYAWLIIASFSTRTYGLDVEGWTLSNWSEFVAPGARPFGRGSYPSIWRVTLNSALISLIMVVLVVGVSSLAGYALSRLNFRGRRGFLSLTLILHAFPSVTLLIAIFFVLRTLHLFDTIMGVALVMVTLQLPLGIWLMKGFFDNVPWDIERAALIDGASRFRVWWQIVMPLIRPGIAALSTFAFLFAWGEFLIVKTFTIGSNTGNLSVYLENFIGDTAPTNWNVVAAVGLFQLMPVLVFFIFAQEYLLNIYAGGSKGE
ncbi:MAG: carbohydrate ABC transporter permease [Chloroflexi bacterium]|nr:carbohydrate ABC transporter permease [Chloroflexota bacterium]